MAEETPKPKTEADPNMDLELDTGSKPGLISDAQESRDKETLNKAEALLKKATTAEDYQQLAKLYAEVERFYLPNELSPSLREQYEKQAKLLEEIGIVKVLESGKLGIEGVDGKEYPMPTQKEIAKRIEENKELIERKQEQGFTELLLVPFGMKLGKLLDAYKQSIIKHYEEGKLFGSKKDPNDETEQLVALELNEVEPIWTWDGYNDADVNGKLVYFPVEFSQNHQGRTKQEILDEQGGWHIILIEDMPNIPRENKGKTVGERKQFEANNTPNNYLETLKDFEEGMTPEDQLMYAITHLEETDQAIDDYQGNGTISYQLGGYFPASGSVPSAYWYRVNRRANLYRNVSVSRSGDCGVRSAVRI